MVSSADGTADIKLNAENDKFGGDLKLKKLLVRLHRSAIQIEPESISQLAPLAKMFLGPELAKALKQGLPFPLKVGENYIVLRTIVLRTFFYFADKSCRIWNIHTIAGACLV